MFRFGARVTTRFRLRWLSERGRFDRGRCGLRWMLKKVPVWACGEWVWWLDTLHQSFHRPPRVTCLDLFLQEASPGADGSTPIAAWRPLLRRHFEQRHHARHRARTRSAARPESSSPPEPGTRFSLPSRSLHARSRRPRSDNHRSRNSFVTRKPRRNTLHGQEDLETKPDTTHQTPGPVRPAPRTAAACEAHFLLLLQPTKVTRPQARSAGRKGLELEVRS